jgi:hypothetical protein
VSRPGCSPTAWAYRGNVGAMVLSGSMALLAAVLVDAPLLLLTPALMIWGLTAVADSALFSAPSPS